MPGAGYRIAVDPQGAAWIVNWYGQIFCWSGSDWISVEGNTTNIGIGAEGSV